MAKVTEGDPYYYAPSSGKYDGKYRYAVFKKQVHPNFELIAQDLSQENASLIVDALNDHHLNQAVLDRI